MMQLQWDSSGRWGFYLKQWFALLCWGDGTPNEFFTPEELVEKFTIERVNKSGAVFDYTKLRWMNGRYLRLLPPAELVQLIGDHWKSRGFVTEPTGSFIVEETLQLLKDGIHLLEDADKGLLDLISYPLHATLATPECKPVVVEDSISEVAATLLAAYDNGEVFAALEEGQSGWQKWVKIFGKALKRKGKALFMPLWLLLTGKLHGPDMGASIILLYKARKFGAVAPGNGFVALDERLNLLRDVEWTSIQKDQA